MKNIIQKLSEADKCDKLWIIAYIIMTVICICISVKACFLYFNNMSLAASSVLKKLGVMAFSVPVVFGISFLIPRQVMFWVWLGLTLLLWFL